MDSRGSSHIQDPLREIAARQAMSAQILDDQSTGKNIAIPAIAKKTIFMGIKRNSAFLLVVFFPPRVMQLIRKYK